jgi:hypothetical protein
MQKNFVHWMFAAILICGACVFTSCSSNEDNPVIVTNGPTITTQPENATYNVGDTTYPKMSVAAKASDGELTYEWFAKIDGTYYSTGITTAELDLKAFIGNMIAWSREEAIGAYTFMCKVTDGKGTVESNEATLTITDLPASGLAENIIGKWMVDALNGQPCPTNLKAVITFLSATKAYGSLSDFYSDSWNSHASADVVIDGNNVTLTAFENEHTKHVTVVDIYSITDKDMRLKSDWKAYTDDKMVINEVWDNERYIRINNDFENDIIGTWEGKVTSAEDEHTDGELHRWEYKADGTYVYYSKENDEWKAGNDVMADYFVDGILLCTRWKKTIDSNELREWWEIESIKDGVMKWKALRMREDGTTYTATFEMTKVQ